MSAIKLHSTVNLGIVPSSTDVVGRAQAAVLESPILAIRGITVEQHADRLVIFGRVSTFYHKQQAQEAVRAVADGMLVVNNVVVQSSIKPA